MVCKNFESGLGWFVKQWQRWRPYDSLFQYFFLLWILGFVRVIFISAFFPGHKRRAQQIFASYVRVCVSWCAQPALSSTPMCACLYGWIWIWTVDILCFWINWKCKRTKGMQNTTSCTKIVECVAYQMNEAKKNRHIMIFFVVIVVFVTWKKE